MTVNIDELTEAELIDLNHRVVERLRFIEQARAHATMLRFKIGDRVCFESEAGILVYGTIVRYNQKSVSLLAEDGRRWRVGPGFLRPASTNEAAQTVSAEIVSLPRKHDHEA